MSTVKRTSTRPHARAAIYISVLPNSATPQSPEDRWRWFDELLPKDAIAFDGWCGDPLGITMLPLKWEEREKIRAVVGRRNVWVRQILQSGLFEVEERRLEIIRVLAKALGWQASDQRIAVHLVAYVPTTERAPENANDQT